MKGDKHIIRGYMNSSIEVYTVYENNGLALVRETLRPYWYCLHINTGMCIDFRRKHSDPHKIKREIKNFVDYLGPLFPWNEWQAENLGKDTAPQWANEAVKIVMEY